MYVGVIPLTSFFIMIELRIPHVCGGDPMKIIIANQVSKYSPCMWG